MLRSLPVVPVVAGVICDAGGRVLLARRTQGRDLAGLWEFPGGKREAGETAFAALQRELAEELGIELVSAEPLIQVPYRYPNKQILLDVYRVSDYRGQPRGLEQQALAWSPIDRLGRYPMPAADLPVLGALTMPPWLAITPPSGLTGSTLLARAQTLIEQGLRWLQLRLPAEPLQVQRELAAKLQAMLAPHGGWVLLNGDIEGAQRIGCGLHLRSAQLDVLAQRPLPAEARLTAACHDARQLHQALRLQVDAALLGPLLPTASHPGQATLGWQGFADLRAGSPLPIFALGGLQRDDLPQARQHGAQGIAAIRAFFD